jgi:hypothetical protein
MTSERMQRRIETFVDEADESTSPGDGSTVAAKAHAPLATDVGNDNADGFLRITAVNDRGRATSISDEIESGKVRRR